MVMMQAWQLARLASWGQPATQLLQGSHQGSFLNNYHYLFSTRRHHGPAILTPPIQSDPRHGSSRNRRRNPLQVVVDVVDPVNQLTF